ncbi:MAG TPA: hypothetical protein VI698_04195 [Nitrososphaerales archaeon]|nr:hypothetical protein [Nitrososphaerales archaeon]
MSDLSVREKESTSSMIRVKANSFEIVRDNNQLSSRIKKQPLLLGYVGVDDDDAKAFEVLKELCSKESVDKIVIVYHDYAFSLLGVSLTENNPNPPGIRFGTKYKFSAKDIQLEGFSGF